MKNASALSAEIKSKVDAFLEDARDAVEFTHLDPRNRLDLAQMATAMISVAPGVDFCRPESAAVVKGVILATLDFADKVRRETVQ
jgi:hypothetical protein